MFWERVFLLEMTWVFNKGRGSDRGNSKGLVALNCYKHQLPTRLKLSRNKVNLKAKLEKT
uniref:Uncharacterized protein n=1 Tax=Octopus bimaculoides TaxID=37653 RepID=A0A0L8GEI2_OCTBM